MTERCNMSLELFNAVFDTFVKNDNNLSDEEIMDKFNQMAQRNNDSNTNTNDNQNTSGISIPIPMKKVIKRTQKMIKVLLIKTQKVLIILPMEVIMILMKKNQKV